MQLSSAVLLLCTLFALTLAQPNCGLSGTYTCSGGNIRGLEFGDDEDDDFFKYYLTDGNSECSLFQEGTYLASTTSSTITTELGTDDDECVVVGDNTAGCTCRTSLSLTATDGCDTLTVSTGETCTSNENCSNDFTCANGQTPQPRPGYEPDANGCGPSALPLAGPSFGFLSCCEQHDFCYGTCNTDRAQCDNDFYTCMYCICQDSDNFFEREICEELACSYFQAVDEFGCPSFRGGQEDSCVCNAKDAAHAPGAMKSAPSKFGPGFKTQRQTELFCDAPFTPDTCPSTPTNPTSTTRTPSPSAQGNRDITVSRTPSPSRNVNSGITPSRTPSRVVPAPNPVPNPVPNPADDDDDDSTNTISVNTQSNDDDDDDSTNTISVNTQSNDDDDDDSTNTISVGVTVNSDDDDDDSSSASAVLIGSLLMVAVLIL